MKTAGDVLGQPRGDTPKPFRLSRKRHLIGLVAPSIYEGGGVPSVARFLADAISKSDEFDLKIVSLATSARDPESVRLLKPATWRRGVQSRIGEWEGRRYEHVGAFMAEIEFHRYRQRRRLLEALKDVDLVQVVSGGPAWALSVVGLDKPTVLQVATRTIVERRRRQSVERGPIASWRWLMTRITDRMDNKALRSVDAVLVENPWMLTYACNHAAPYGAWVRYAPPGIDCSTFSPAPDRPSRMSCDNYILAVGRFNDPRKNPDLLLNAYAEVRRRTPTPVRLQLAGSGEPDPKFWRRVRELAYSSDVNFHMKPSKAELAEYYRGAACFALSSDEEGLGIVVLEAMASAVPVVATRCGGPDGIISDGVDGFLVQTGDAQAMAERILQLLSDADKNASMGKKARATVESQFESGIAAERYLQTYRRLLAKVKDEDAKCAD